MESNLSSSTPPEELSSNLSSSTPPEELPEELDSLVLEAAPSSSKETRIASSTSSTSSGVLGRGPGPSNNLSNLSKARNSCNISQTSSSGPGTSTSKFPGGGKHHTGTPWGKNSFSSNSSLNSSSKGWGTNSSVNNVNSSSKGSSSKHGVLGSYSWSNYAPAPNFGTNNLVPSYYNYPYQSTAVAQQTVCNVLGVSGGPPGIIGNTNSKSSLNRASGNHNGTLNSNGVGGHGFKSNKDLNQFQTLAPGPSGPAGLGPHLYHYNYPDEHETLLGAQQLQIFDVDLQPGSAYDRKLLSTLGGPIVEAFFFSDEMDSSESINNNSDTISAEDAGGHAEGNPMPIKTNLSKLKLNPYFGGQNGLDLKREVGFVPGEVLFSTYEKEMKRWRAESRRIFKCRLAALEARNSIKELKDVNDTLKDKDNLVKSNTSTTVTSDKNNIDLTSETTVTASSDKDNKTSLVTASSDKDNTLPLPRAFPPSLTPQQKQRLQNFNFNILRRSCWRYLGHSDVYIDRHFGGGSNCNHGGPNSNLNISSNNRGENSNLKENLSLTMKYTDYKADCIAFLRFLLSQEPASCDWRLGYLLAMCLKRDHGHKQVGRELEKVCDSQMFSLLTQLFIQDARASQIHELEEIFFSMGGRKKNSHVLAAMIRGYGCKGYWKCALRLFLIARERNLEEDSKDWEYRYLCYQACLDWALNNGISYMTYTILRFCQIDGIPIRYPGAGGGKISGGVDFVRWPVEELRFMWAGEKGAPKIKYYASPSTPGPERLDSGPTEYRPEHQGTSGYMFEQPPGSTKSDTSTSTNSASLSLTGGSLSNTMGQSSYKFCNGGDSSLSTTDSVDTVNNHNIHLQNHQTQSHCHLTNNGYTVKVAGAIPGAINAMPGGKGAVV